MLGWFPECCSWDFFKCIRQGWRAPHQAKCTCWLNFHGFHKLVPASNVFRWTYFCFMFLHLTFIQDLRKLMLFRSLLQFVIDVSSPFWHVLFNNFCMLPLLYNTCSSCIITSQVPSAQYFQWCIKSLLSCNSGFFYNSVTQTICMVLLQLPPCLC